MITLKQLKDKLHKDFGWENLESDDNKWFVDNLLKDTIQAIEVIHCCKSDSEQLKINSIKSFKQWKKEYAIKISEDLFLYNEVELTSKKLKELYDAGVQLMS